jgi:DNA polymerase-3 subunit delta'
MGWDEIVGQQRVKNLLRKAIESKRLPHAYLFFGPNGVGKDAMAIELAKVVNCERQRSSACDACESCKRFGSLQHPNLMLIFALPIGKSERAGDPSLAKLSNEDVDQVREQIRRKSLDRYHSINVPRATTIKVNSIRDIKRDVSLTAYMRGKKVIIIFDAENMNDESANALLKTLEEPTDDTLFILTSSYRDQLFPTIISRCQEIRFDILSEEEIQTYLIQTKSVDSPNAMLIARLANGSLSHAVDLLNVDLQDLRENVLRFLRTLYSADELEILQFIEQLNRDYDRTEVQRFLQLLQLWLRDALCIKEGFEAITNIDQRESIVRFAQRYADVSFSELITSADRAISLIYKNAYIPLVLAVFAQTIQRSIRKT